jgi:hypothetical protein
MGGRSTKGLLTGEVYTTVNLGKKHDPDYTCHAGTSDAISVQTVRDAEQTREHTSHRAEISLAALAFASTASADPKLSVSAKSAMTYRTRC